MRTQQPAGKAIWGMAMLLAFGTMGCSTKKFVRQTVAPIEAKTAELEKKSTQHEGQIEDLQKKVSATDERAMTADRKAQEAAESAAKAQQTAQQAQSSASDAQSLAQQGMAKTDEVERTLSSKVENMDNYTLLSSETVQFNLNSSELTKDAQSQLDAAIEKIGSAKHFVIEVQGFTDTTGPVTYNLELSRRRADAVVRYLTMTGKVPLFRIQMVGYGKDNPVAANDDRKGREANRRVEIKLFAAESAGQESANANVGNP